ncbi:MULTISPECIES: hypothetical protein [Aequorivita]|uniref:Uncharacterized protein n=1 Tax=Aequorivita iocasae TaxID=2803865 RepID=A0ABX7DS58_9FLAO|nr:MULTISPECIES: hypothetical protein [Aequorivita]QQX75619.1 hypothetical protein JK629_09715 [Aequorivita iocasae]UCA55075.1 hypothetical protein LDL78_09765 [Aequorivita sp. F7]
MANLSENRLNEVLDPAVLSAAITGLDAFMEGLPEGVLNDDQRRRYTGMDVDNRVFVETVLDVMAGSGASVLPASFQLATLQVDYQLFEQVKAVLARVAQVQRKLEDLLRISAHEAFTYALAVYAIYETMSKAGSEDARAGFELMRERFAGQGGGRPAEEEL